MTRIEKTPAQVLGSMLKELRKQAKVNQSQIAKHLGFGGNSNVSDIESGQRHIRLWEFIEICNYLQVRPSELLDEYIETVPSLKPELQSKDASNQATES